MAPGYARAILGGLLATVLVQQGWAAVHAEVKKHKAGTCSGNDMDKEAYFQRFTEKYPVPTKALQYNGISAPERCYEGDGEEHFFILGDYGGITCNDRSGTDGKRDPWSYTCGRRDSGENRGRKDVYVKCADNTKDHPERGRHFTPSDAKPQFFVADQMRTAALTSKPRFILNGGDNFYFGGIDLRCGLPMDTVHNRTQVQFDGVFEKMYSGTDLKVPWFSTLGNHDYGGRKFDAAWDQQIAYTWSTNSSHTWFLPGLYWHQRVNYPTKNFTIDILMLDTNKGDAKHWTADKGHNICGSFNDARNDCSAAGGPKSRYTCQGWFQNLWNTQKKWVEDKLMHSDADWQILVSHFPAENFRGELKDWHRRFGVDLYVGSHRHSQELHMRTKWLNGLSYIVAGGGGGITSENNPSSWGGGQRQYGFMDIAINKTHMNIRSINEHGKVVQQDTITPQPGQGEPTCKHYGCGAEFADWRACQCTADCWTHARDWHKNKRCCSDYAATCPALASCASLGCGGKADYRKPCQCSKGCEEKNNCCSDYQTLCNTPEAQEADRNCAADCEIEGQRGAHSCASRVDYAIRRMHKSVADAINLTNTDCATQCNCSVKYYSQGSSSLLEEDVSDESEVAGEEIEEDADDQAMDEEVDAKQTGILEKKIHLEEELRSIDQKLSGSPASDEDEMQSVWAEYMNTEDSE
jgi:hypothetical protein